MDPLTIAALVSAASAAASTAGGFLNRGSKETKTQRTQRKLVDDLVASLKGRGSYNDLFNADEATFQKSFVDPAKQRFRSQIAPQIQQQYIASGQQRGTGLDDTLTRAGVDLDQLLNQYYANFQQSALDRKQSAMNSILGAGAGIDRMSGAQAAGQGFSGYLSGEGFQKDLGGIMRAYENRPQSEPIQDVIRQPRKGFENDYQYDPYTGVQE